MLRSHHKAFTLIELMLAMSLMGVLALTAFSIIWNLLEVSAVGERFQAAQLELARAERRLNFLIRNADSVEAVASDSVTLGIAGSSDTVTVSLINGVLVVEQDSETTPLTGDRLGVSSLQFFEYTASGGNARMINYEIYGSSRVGADTFPVVVRGGAEVRSLINP